MQPERPLLTIAIPTSNRSSFLSQLLSVLGPQLADETRVELLISDNASPDDTPSVVEFFRKKGLAVTYSRNDVNIGPDANFIRCYGMAQGEYVWIFGDDDVIVPGGLREVLRYLEQRTYDLIHIRSAGFSGPYIVPVNPTFTRKIIACSGPQEFALHINTGLTFISGIISRKSKLEGVPIAEFEKQIGTNLAQLSWTFSLLRLNPRCVCVLDKLIASRVENSGGYAVSQVFGKNLRAMVEAFFGFESPVGRAILNRTIQCWFPWAVLQSRRGRHDRHLKEDTRSTLMALNRNNPRYWFFVHPLFKLPLPMAEAWLFGTRVVNRMDRLLGYPIAR